MIAPVGGGIDPNGSGYMGQDMHTLYPNGSVYQRNDPNGPHKYSWPKSWSWPSHVNRPKH